MNRLTRFTPLLILLLVATTRAADPTTAPSAAQALYDQVTPSLVGVQFAWNYEFGRIELVGPGIVVSDDGLILLPGDVVSPNFPDDQLKDFKIIVPGTDKDDEELDATFEGRDERNNVAFVRAKAGSGHVWKPVKFVDEALTIGEPLLSVGLLAKQAGYRSYLTTATVAAHVRGEIPQILVSGALSSVGAAVFTADGKAVGLVNTPQFNQAPYLHRSGGREDINPLAPIIEPPHLFTQTSQFIQSLNDPPTAAKPIPLNWVGLPQLAGMMKDVAQVFGLQNQPAIEIGDVIPDSPADKAGMKVGQKIVKVNGQPLERGDEPEELPQILHRKLARMKVGDNVTFSVLTKKGQPLQDFKVTLGERPPRANVVKRFFAEDLGFGAREVTFEDTYIRKKPQSFPGVVVTLLKPSGAAQTAKLAREDLITEMNSTPVTTLDAFVKDYQALRKDKPKDAVVLVVLKPDNTNETIRIEPPQ